MADRSARRVREMFGEIARRYDFLNHVLSFGIDCGWRRKTVRLATPSNPPTGAILDVCTGTGDLALAFWRRYGRFGTTVVGTDFCPEMLECACRKRARRGIVPEQLAFREADTCDLPFEDGAFQVVAVAFGLRNVEDTGRGLAEMVRVCAPGGRVAILEFTTPRRCVVRWAYHLYFHHVLPRLGQLLARNHFEAYRYLPETVGEFPQREALLALMRQAGLTEVRYHALTCGVAALYLGEKE